MFTLLNALFFGCDSVTFENKSLEEEDVVTVEQCGEKNECTDPGPCYDGTTAFTLPQGYLLKTTGTWSCSKNPAVWATLYLQELTFSDKNVTNNGASIATTVAKDTANDFSKGQDSWIYSTPAPAVHWNTSISQRLPDITHRTTLWDGNSDIHLLDDAWTAQKWIAALTSCVSDSTYNEGNCCQYTECDITLFTYVLNDNNEKTPIKWSISEVPTAGYFSLSYVFAHELGHLLGLKDQDPSLFPGTLMSGY